jgi:hypothetical protein
LLSAAPRPPKPTATGRILDDGTYEVILGDQFAIRHKPVDEFDRCMFLLFLRDIHLVERPLPWGYHLQHILCGNWEAVDDGTSYNGSRNSDTRPGKRKSA